MAEVDVAPGSSLGTSKAHPNLIERVLSGDVTAPTPIVVAAMAAVSNEWREAALRHGVPVLTALSHLVAEGAGALDVPWPEFSDTERLARRPKVEALLRALLGSRTIQDRIVGAACTALLDVRDDFRTQGLHLDREDHVLPVLCWGYQVLLRVWCSTTPVLLAGCLLGSHVEAVDAVEVAIAAAQPGGPLLVPSLQRAARAAWMRDVHYSTAAEDLIAGAAELLGEGAPPPVDRPRVRRMLRETLERAQAEVFDPPDPRSDTPLSRARRHAHLGLLTDLIGKGPRADVRLRELLEHWRGRAAWDSRHFVYRDDGGRSTGDRVFESQDRPGDADPALSVEASDFLACLSDRERRALDRCFVEGASYVAVGAEFGVSDVAARKLVKRALRKLLRRNGLPAR